MIDKKFKEIKRDQQNYFLKIDIKVRVYNFVTLLYKTNKKISTKNLERRAKGKIKLYHN